jgi:hypothetical protein
MCEKKNLKPLLSEKNIVEFHPSKAQGDIGFKTFCQAEFNRSLTTKCSLDN